MTCVMAYRSDRHRTKPIPPLAHGGPERNWLSVCDCPSWLGVNDATEKPNIQPHPIQVAAHASLHIREESIYRGREAGRWRQAERGINSGPPGAVLY